MIEVKGVFISWVILSIKTFLSLAISSSFSTFCLTASVMVLKSAVSSPISSLDLISMALYSPLATFMVDFRSRLIRLVSSFERISMINATTTETIGPSTLKKRRDHGGK